MSEKTPIAVTSAPAPGPCTTSGVRAYRFVVNAMRLSLACHVLAGQVLARVGFGVAHPVGFADQRAEWNRAVECVEQVAQGAGEHALDFRNHVSAGDQIPQRRDDGQSCADVGLVEKMFL